MNSIVSKIKALADNNRFRICLLLKEKSLCVCELLSVLNVAGGTLSNHLKILKNCGIIEQEKSGKWIIYSLSDSAGDIVDFLASKIENREQLDKDLANLKMSDRQKCAV